MSLTTTRSPYLTGIYAPVDDEVTHPDLEVIGDLPDDLAGMFVRTGSNPKHEPPGRYHWFDGDGMVHGLHLEDGRATYRNRYVRTAGLAADDDADRCRLGGILETPNWDEPDSPFKDTSNTDLVFHAGRLYSLWWLSGAAHVLELPELTTAGVDDFDGTLPRSISAHSKVDPRRDELVWFDYSPLAPHLTIGTIDRSGAIVHHEPVELPGYRLQHDIAFTDRYTLVFDLSMEAAGQGMAMNRSRPGRIGLVPRRGVGSDVQWFEVEPFFMYHVINAWDDGDEVVMTGCRIANPTEECPSDRPAPVLGGLRLEPYLHQWRLDPTTGAVTENQLDDRLAEFPRMNDAWLGRRSRFAYDQRIATDRETLLFDGVIKYDLETGEATEFSYPEGWFGGETSFVPRPGTDPLDPGAEDDGYLVTFVTEEATGASEAYLLDATDLAADPVARMPIPARLPYGYHTRWIDQADIDAQRPLAPAAST